LVVPPVPVAPEDEPPDELLDELLELVLLSEHATPTTTKATATKEETRVRMRKVLS